MARLPVTPRGRLAGHLSLTEQQMSSLGPPTHCVVWLWAMIGLHSCRETLDKPLLLAQVSTSTPDLVITAATSQGQWGPLIGNHVIFSPRLKAGAFLNLSKIVKSPETLRGQEPWGSREPPDSYWQHHYWVTCDSRTLGAQI